MSCKLEPVIWSHDTGQRIPCFDRCQLINNMAVNLLFGVWQPSCATPSHHEKIHSWVTFSFLYEYGAPLGGPSGRQSSAIITSSENLGEIAPFEFQNTNVNINWHRPLVCFLSKIAPKIRKLGGN